jgi:hypothetical protein
MKLMLSEHSQQVYLNSHMNRAQVHPLVTLPTKRLQLQLVISSSQEGLMQHLLAQAQGLH